jgi:hypothetical protein
MLLALADDDLSVMANSDLLLLLLLLLLLAYG